ncbi:unnamed protein product [Urochloa humidicola]
MAGEKGCMMRCATKSVEGEKIKADVADGNDESTEMSWTDFVVANKRLSQEEIDYILSRQLQPFESTYKFQSMISDSSTTKEDLERAGADHQREQSDLSELQEWVHKEYAEKRFVEVNDEGIARRLEFDAHVKEGWSSMISELDLHDSDFADELEDEEEDDFFNDVEEKADVGVSL